MTGRNREQTRLGTLSIKQKLTILIVTTSGVAVLMACVAVGAYHYRRSKDALVRETTELAVIIETNSQAALAFRDAAGGDEILSALAANAHIAAAAIYDSEGRLFGTYARTITLQQRRSTTLRDGYLEHTPAATVRRPHSSRQVRPRHSEAMTWSSCDPSFLETKRSGASRLCPTSWSSRKARDSLCGSGHRAHLETTSPQRPRRHRHQHVDPQRGLATP